MREIKTNCIFIDKLTCLLNVRAESVSQSRLKKMSRSMISCDRLSSVRIDSGLYIVARLGIVAVNNSAVVEKYAVVGLGGVFDLKGEAVTVNISRVSDLSAALGIESSFVRNEERVCTVFEYIASDTVCDESNNFTLCFKCVIACKIGLFKSLCDNARIVPALCTSALMSVTGSLSLNKDKLLKFLLVNGHSLFLKNFLGEVDRESEGILKLERILCAELI